MWASPLRLSATAASTRTRVPAAGSTISYALAETGSRATGRLSLLLRVEGEEADQGAVVAPPPVVAQDHPAGADPGGGADLGEAVLQLASGRRVGAGADRDPLGLAGQGAGGEQRVGAGVETGARAIRRQEDGSQPRVGAPQAGAVEIQTALEALAVLPLHFLPLEGDVAEAELVEAGEPRPEPLSAQEVARAEGGDPRLAVAHQPEPVRHREESRRRSGRAPLHPAAGSSLRGGAPRRPPPAGAPPSRPRRGGSRCPGAAPRRPWGRRRGRSPPGGRPASRRAAPRDRPPFPDRGPAPGGGPRRAAAGSCRRARRREGSVAAASWKPQRSWPGATEQRWIRGPSPPPGTAKTSALPASTNQTSGEESRRRGALPASRTSSLSANARSRPDMVYSALISRA